jgi:hypothetical protein
VFHNPSGNNNKDDKESKEPDYDEGKTQFAKSKGEEMKTGLASYKDCKTDCQ